MFEPDLYAQLRTVARAAAEARSSTGLAQGAQLCEAARMVQQAQDLLDGVAADLAAKVEETQAHHEEGAPTAASWMVRELRVPVRQARTRVAAGRTLHRLPPVAEALTSGEIRLDHVQVFTAGIKKLGDETLTDSLELLVPVAKSADPHELRQAVDHLYQTVYPERLDEAWARGMDKRDLDVARCGDGYHVSGFLDILTGAKLHAFLKAASAGHGPDDSRAPSQRRIDALGRLVDTAAERGDPGNGLRPQLHVLAELETLRGRSGAQAASLAGFGAIGRELLGYLTCTSDVTPVLTDGHTAGATPQARVLNVGRTHRLATSQQRSAVIARQHGHCANPGCTNTLLEVHHVAWWNRDGGLTDLPNLVGLCSRCHHLTHRETLTVEPDGQGGFGFRRSTGTRIDDHARRTRHRIRRLLRNALREQAPALPAPRPPERRQPRRPRSIGEDHLHQLIEHHRPVRT